MPATQTITKPNHNQCFQIKLKFFLHISVVTCKTYVPTHFKYDHHHHHK